MGSSVRHKKEIVINKEKLTKVLKGKNLTYSELLQRIKKSYGIDLSYKGFMTLLFNRSTWKLLYAVAICDQLDLKIEDIFEIVDYKVSQGLD